MPALSLVRPIARHLLAATVVLTGSYSLHAQSTGTTGVALSQNGFVVNSVTALEQVQYAWTAPSIGSSNSLGSITITDTASTSSSPITLPTFIYSPAGGLTLQSIALKASPTPVMLLTFSTSSGPVHVTLTPSLDGKLACATIVADAPVISLVGASTWPASLGGRDISVPYYTQAVHYFDAMGLFANIFLDPFASHATTFYQNSASYVANTSGNLNAVHETLKIGVSSNIMNVLPYPENPASPYMATLAGRLMLDVQSGSFSSVASALTNLNDYGISNCVAIMHVWQHYGYDNALPAHYSADPSMGGDAPMASVGAAAKQASCLFGLHQNYADYYPNYPEYTASATTLQADGTQLPAWLNPTSNIQSFATKPNLFVTNATTQSPKIHNAYGTSATFIDVNSSATPWWRADMDANAPGSAMFGTYRDASTALWAYERSVENGPVFGEGKNHWFWSGLLDGVEAQFGAESTPITDGTQAPLFVDFDLTRIHPLQVNYGMGFYERWMKGGATINTTSALDAYRMQEIIFGHAPFLSDALWSSVPHALQEQNLVGPLANSYALQTPSSIRYDVNSTWVDASTAAKSGDFSIAQVVYPSGETILANSNSKALSWNGFVIPQYGWLAYGAGLLAGTAQLNGILVDYAQTSQSLYANARNQGDLLSEGTLAEPEVVNFTQTGPRAFSLQLGWNAFTPDPDDSLQGFIHFVNYQATSDPEGIVDALAETPSVPTSSWTVGQLIQDQAQSHTLPPSMPDGAYAIRVGLYDSSSRAILYGNDDGSRRYTIGTMTVADSGQSITFSPAAVAITSPDPRLNSTGQVVDFSTVRTDGMVSIALRVTSASSGQLTLRTYPRYRDVVAQISTAFLPMPALLHCSDGTTLQPTLTADGGHWQTSLRAKKYCTWNVAWTPTTSSKP